MKKVICFIMASVLCFCTTGLTVNASEHKENNVLYEISVIDNTTNQEVEIEMVSEKIVPEISQQSLYAEDQEVECDVVFLLPVNNNDKTRSSISSEQEKASIRAKLTLTYSISGEQIKVSKISGFWECIDNNYSMTFSNREVNVNDGRPLNTGKVMEKHPTTNSFSYDTGWGYVQYYPNSSDAMSGARGYSEATGSIDGMGGSYTIFTTVAVP